MKPLFLNFSLGFSLSEQSFEQPWEGRSYSWYVCPPEFTFKNYTFSFKIEEYVITTYGAGERQVIKMQNE